MTDDLGVIRVGLAVSMNKVDADLAAIKKKIGPLEAEHTIPFKVGSVGGLAEVKRQIEQVTKGNVPVTLNVGISKSAGAQIKRDLQAQLKAAGPVKVDIAPNLSRAAIAQMRRDIIAAIGTIPLNFSGAAGSGGAPGAPARPTRPGSGPTTASRTPRTAGVASSLPAAAVIASGAVPPEGFTLRDVEKFWRDQSRTLDAWERESARVQRRRENMAANAERQARSRAQRDYSRRPAPTPPPPAAPYEGMGDFGSLPTGEASSVTYRTRGGSTTPMAPRGRRATKAAAQSTREVSLNSMRAQTSRPRTPETEAEIEYASRPTQAQVPLTQAEIEDLDASGRGVRGASRSGARRRGERILTAGDAMAIENERERQEFLAGEGRAERVRVGDRRRGTGYRNPGRLRHGMDIRQFYRFNPRLGEAFEALQRGDTSDARAMLQGVSLEIMSADPKKRARFFRQLDNVENMSPEMLQQHAQLRALFSEIAITDATTRLGNAENAVKAFPKPKGPQIGWPEDQLDAYKDLLGAKQAALKDYQMVLRGLKRRAGGGGVVSSRDVDREIRSILPNARGDRMGPVDKDALDDILSALGSNAKVFPKSAASLVDLWDNPDWDDPNWRTSTKGVLAGVRPFGRLGSTEMAFSPQLLRDSEFRDYLRAKSRINETNYDPVGVTTHEFGHVVDMNHMRRLSSHAAGIPISSYGATSPSENAAELYFKAMMFPRELDNPEFKSYLEALSSIRTQEAGFASGGRMTAGLKPGEIPAGGMFANMVLGMPWEPAHRGFLKRTSEGGASGRPYRKPGYAGPPGGGAFANQLIFGDSGKAGGGYLVGEKRPELFRGKSGRSWILGKRGPQMFYPPEDGTVDAAVPAWAAHMDRTRRRAPGGRVNFQTEDPRYHTGFRSPFEGERAAVLAGQLSGSGGVQRVFVVNWPAGGFGGRGGLSGRAASPTSAEIEGQVGGGIQEILRNTVSATPGASTKEGPFRLGRLDPAEELQAKLDAITTEGAKQLRSRAVQARASLSQTASEAPVRSLAPAIGQITATFLGRGELLKRLGVAREAIQQMTKAETFFNAQVEKENQLQIALNKETNPEKRKEIEEAITRQGEATKLADGYLKESVVTAEKATKAADAFGLKLGVLTGNTLGIVGGTLAFGATLGAAQLALMGIGEVLGPALERMSGYANVSGQVTSALADQTRQQNGNTKAVVAAAEAQAGLNKQTSDTISPLLEQRAATEAGNKALSDSLALLHTFESVRAQNAGKGGADKGLTSTTGGFFGTILNGIPSTSELVGNELGVVNQQNNPAEVARLQAARAALGEHPTGRQLQAQAALDRQIAAFGGTFDVGQGRMDFFNAQIQKGGQTFKFVAQHSIQLDDATREAAAAAADAAGAFDIANNIRDKRAILVDQNNKIVVSQQQYIDALDALNKGLTTPDLDNLLKQQERQIKAQIELTRAQGAFERNAINPAQLALREAANPTPGLEGGPEFGEGIIGKGDKAAAAAAGRYKNMVGPAIDYINKEIAKGHEALVALVPQDLRGEFTSLLGDIASTGSQIQKIQLGLSQQAVNLDVAQYNEQLRIANRSLRDARDLQAALGGETRNTLGGIEGQNILIQRQLQLLQFELQQRQINYKVALAGFVAPGSTPEERAARIEEAKIEASYAQKQLDLQKQLSANEFKGVRISADRNVTDLLNQISLLEQGRELTINTAAANRAIDILSKKLDYQTAKAQSMVNEGVKISQAAMEAAADAAAATGKAYSYILNQTAKAWGIFGKQAELMLQGLIGAAPGPGTAGAGGGRHIKKAGGGIGVTHGAEHMIVGEAMGEAYAILKDPRLVPTPSIGGTAGSTVNVGGITVEIHMDGSGNSEEQARDMAEAVARQVERLLSEKLNLVQARPLG